LPDTLDPRRTIAELKELRALTGNADGAQRIHGRMHMEFPVR